MMRLWETMKAQQRGSKWRRGRGFDAVNCDSLAGVSGGDRDGEGCKFGERERHFMYVRACRPGYRWDLQSPPISLLFPIFSAGASGAQHHPI